MFNAAALQAYFDSIPKDQVPFTDCEIRQNGQTLFRYGQGFSDYEKTRPVSNTDMYWIYSCSKVVTAVATLRLVEQGKLGLYDLLETYIPEYANMTVLQAKEAAVYDPVKAAFVGGAGAATEQIAVPAKNKIRIYDLLRMASGLSYDMTIPQIQTMREDNTLGNLAFAKLLAQVPLKFEPGTDFLYSFSHNILGAVIELVTGMGFDVFLQKEIFDPLGMAHTGFVLREDDTYHLAAQYMMDAETGEFHPISGNEYVLNSAMRCGGAGLISTVDDLIRFCDVLANGGTTKDGYRLLKPETIDLMRQDHANATQKTALHTNWPHLINYSYGLGVRTFVENRDGNGGEPGEFGWEGAAGSLLVIDPNNHISCVYTQHVRKSSYATDHIHRRILKAIYNP